MAAARRALMGLAVLAALLGAHDPASAQRAAASRDPAAAAVRRRLATPELRGCRPEGAPFRVTRDALAQRVACADTPASARPLLVVGTGQGRASLVRGALARAWQSARYALSPARPLYARLGAPLGDAEDAGAARVQRFESGELVIAHPFDKASVAVYLREGAALRPASARRLTTDEAISALAEVTRAEGEASRVIAAARARGPLRYLGAGRVSAAWTDGARVYKLVQHGHPYGDFDPALDRLLTPAEREQIARESVDVIAALRADPAFVREVGRVVPAARWLGGAWIAQDFAAGVPFTALGDAARRVAERERARVRDAARRVVVRDRATGRALPPVFYDWNSDNFRFNPDGTIAAWFDPATPSLDRPWAP